MTSLPELTIDRLSYGGRGVGRDRDGVVFVPDVVPGERVRVRITRRHKRYREAEPVELLAPSPLRRTAPCPLFGVCGGCQWQHLPYAEQARQKGAIFADLLTRHGDVPPAALQPLWAADEEWGYRSRTQLKAELRDGRLRLGFYRRGSHELVPCERCLLLPAALNEALAWLPERLRGVPGLDRLRRLDLERGDDGARRLTLHLGRGPRTGPLLTELERRLAATGWSVAVQLEGGSQWRLLQGAAELAVWPEGEGGPVLAYGPGGFAQVNPRQNRQLVAAVKATVSELGVARVLDLYCGMGNFSLPLARTGCAVLGIESGFAAVAMARENARRHGLETTRFIAGDAAAALRRLGAEERFDLVLLDPPRGGAGEVLPELSALAAPAILYVSCDPSTLARDLRQLQAQGYRCRWSRPVDLFPQTFHVESLTLLQREA